MHVGYTYFLSDGTTYSVQGNLTLTLDSQFANSKDALGNPYQTVIGISGTRLYRYLPTGASVTSNITGLSLSLSTAASQRLYPYTLLSASPSVYYTANAPFFDGSGLEFSVAPAVPALGAAPGDGLLTNTVIFRVASTSPQGVAQLLESETTISSSSYLPLVSLQQQTYTLLP